MAENKALLVEMHRVPPHAYSELQVREYLLTEGTVNAVRLGDLLNDFHDACVDGRENLPVIGSPGGDTAIFVEVMSYVYKKRGNRLTEEDYKSGMRWYVGEFGTFYHHSDEHALKAMLKALPQDWNVAKVKEPEQIIRNPELAQREIVLRLLTNPDFMGCGHLREMMRNPGAYGIESEVVEGVLRAFFTSMWDATDEEREKYNFRVLEGDHAEGAVLIVDTDEEELNEDSLIPTIVPTNGIMSVFVYHKRVIEFMHHLVGAKLIASGMFGLDQHDLDDFIKHLGQTEQENTRETVSRLGFGLPVFHPIFSAAYLKEIWEAKQKEK